MEMYIHKGTQQVSSTGQVYVNKLYETLAKDLYVKELYVKDLYVKDLYVKDLYKNERYKPPVKEMPTGQLQLKSFPGLRSQALGD